MRFAFIIFKYFPYGGVQRDMLRIAGDLAQRGVAVEIYTMSWAGEPPSGIEVHLIRSRGLFNHQRYAHFIRQAQAEIRSKRFDLVLGFNRMPQLDAYFAADSCFIERAHQERGFLYRLSARYRWFAACERAVFAADASCQILLLSPREKTDFQHWYATPEQRFHLLPPYLAAERLALRDKAQMRQRLRDTFGLTAADQVLLLVGSGFRTKGLDRAILALAALPRSILSATHLIAVGQDNPRHYQRLARKLGVTGHVHIAAGRDDVPQLMQGADLLVHPARHELAGHVLLEAMASGLPVLVSDVCGYASHIQQAGAGRLLPSPFSQPVLNACLLDMLQSGQRQAWSSEGIDYAGSIMRANPGGAEASLLLELARARPSASGSEHDWA